MICSAFDCNERKAVAEFSGGFSLSAIYPLRLLVGSELRIRLAELLVVDAKSFILDV
jgi:hypothetical protein